MICRFLLQSGTLVPVDSADALVHAYINPTVDEQAALQRAYEVDDHTLSSALDPDEVSRIEFQSDRVLLIWKRAARYSAQDSFFFNVASVGILVYKDRLVVVANDEIAPKEMAARGVTPPAAPLDLALGFLFSTIRHYLEHLKVIRTIARDLQRKINTSMENKHLIQMFNLSESLVYYINAINSNGVVLTRLRAHAERESFTPEVVAFLDDLIIENTQCLRQAEIYSTVFSGLMDARGTLVNNNMNMLLKNLTIINVVFLPLNLVASIGGMSEFSMMTHGLDWRMAYALFCLGMIALGWFTAVVLKRMGSGDSLDGKNAGARRLERR